jgi:hypothetical protein
MIHPRRLKGTPANLARYYSVGDYYSKGADEHSEWGGVIARDLGLEGQAVEPVLFKELLSGTIAGQQLGRRRTNGEVEHHPGWDFAVNAPKSVSIMALVAGDDRILAAHERAVGIALGYLEEHATLRRRDSGEIVQETTGRLIFARFTEHASRELDPHLHTHVVVMNMTNRWRAWKPGRCLPNRWSRARSTATNWPIPCAGSATRSTMIHARACSKFAGCRQSSPARFPSGPSRSTHTQKTMALQGKPRDESRSTRLVRPR